MNMFENIVEDENGQFSLDLWMQWYHFYVPNDEPERRSMRQLLALFKHCLSCTALSGCYVSYNVLPSDKLHEECDCVTYPIDWQKVRMHASATCDINKFKNYIFGDAGKKNGKYKIFTNMGFDIEDSLYLKSAFEGQALKQYLAGNYKIKGIDLYGARLAIPIELNGTEFYSGWMLLPQGKLQNTTPFGGKI